ncbi:MAG: hypothetical protein U1E76_03500 [Planctomycetota bacterium]
MPDADDMAARSRQLAKDLLDDMDRPKSPEREAYEAQKEREDREALERFYIATGQLKPEQVAQRALVELADTIERIAPKATFEPVEVPVTLAGRKGVLRFAPSPSKPDKRYVELSISSESGLSTSSQWLESGTNEELAAYLRKPEVIAATIATAEELVQSLSRNRLA